MIQSSKMHTINSHSRNPVPFLVTALGIAIFLRLGAVLALPIITFSIGLAIVGPSKWIKWIAVFLLAAMVSGGIFAIAMAIVPMEGMWVGLGLFGIVPLLPALFLWLAVLVSGREVEVGNG
jgi:hypothetical protein